MKSTLIFTFFFLANLFFTNDGVAAARSEVLSQVENTENTTSPQNQQKQEKRLDRFQKKMKKKMGNWKRKGLVGASFNLETVGWIVVALGATFVLLGLLIPYIGILFTIIGALIAFAGVVVLLVLDGVVVSAEDSPRVR